jgi:hypothetical protein
MGYFFGGVFGGFGLRFFQLWSLIIACCYWIVLVVLCPLGALLWVLCHLLIGYLIKIIIEIFCFRSNFHEMIIFIYLFLGSFNII